MTQSWHNIWLENEIHIFRLQGDRAGYLGRDIRIHKLSWVNLPGLARITLSGPMRQIEELALLQNGDSLAILRKLHGHMSEYIPEETVIQIDNCTVLERWLDNISPTGPYENWVELQAIIEGEMRIL